MDWRAVAIVLRRRWRAATAVFLAVWALVLVATWLQTPTYEAQVALSVRQAAPSVGLAVDSSITALLGIGSQPLEAQQWMLTNPILLEEAALNLGMTQSGTKIAKRMRVLLIGTTLVVVKLEDTDPRRAADLANEIADVHVQQSMGRIQTAMQDSVSDIGEQVEAIERRLATAEEAVEAYRESKSIVDVQSETQKTIGFIASLVSQLASVKADRISTQETADYYREMLRQQDATYVSSTTTTRNPLVQDAEKRLSALEAQRAAESVSRGPEHPTVKRIDEEIAATAADLESALATVAGNQTESANPAYQDARSKLTAAEAAAMALEAKEAAVAGQLATENAKLKHLPGIAQEFGDLQRDVDVASTIYGELMASYERSQLRQDQTPTPVEVLSAAVEPRKPIKPRKTINAALGFLFGIAIAALMMLAAEVLADPLRSDRHASSELDLPVLVSIPKTHRSAAAIMADDTASRSDLGDAFRTLRTNLRIATPNGRPRIIVIAGAGPAEGRTCVAANLAAAFAHAGINTLVIDGDMRGPSIHEQFGVPGDHGLADVLKATAGADECVQASDWPNLSVLPAGSAPPNPAELLDSPRACEIFQQVRDSYAIIIVDSPAWPSPDPLLLANMADECVLVLREGKTSRRAARSLVDQLTNIDRRPLGIASIRG